MAKVDSTRSMVAERAYTSPPIKLKRVLPMAEPQHPNFDIGNYPAWVWILAITNLLGWSGASAPKVWAWLARLFESDQKRRQRIDAEVQKRQEEDDSRKFALYERMFKQQEETISALRGQVNGFISSMGDLQRAVGQNQQKIDETNKKVEQVDSKKMGDVFITPEAFENIKKQAEA